MAQKLRFEDSNIALVGSSLDLQQRVASAKLEKEWVGAGKQPGIQIWRVEKFNIKKWPQERFGEFYGGDCYIVLNTYKVNERLAWDVHFWLGRECTQDERGVAAYKTVELDDLLGCAPVQHREVQGYESKLFMSYFHDHITILKGGVDTGFHHVGPKEYKPRLLHCKGKRRVKVTEVECQCSSLNIGDAFVLDAGLTIYKWLPSKAGVTEKFKATQTCDKIRNSRKGCKVIDLGEDGNEEFWSLLGGKGEMTSEQDVPLDEIFDKVRETYVKKMFKLSDAEGKMQFSKIAEGTLSKDALDTNDVFVIDAGAEVIAWIGNGASKDERLKAIQYAQNYLALEKRPCYIPITRVLEGKEGNRFDTLFA